MYHVTNTLFDGTLDPSSGDTPDDNVFLCHPTLFLGLPKCILSQTAFDCNSIKRANNYPCLCMTIIKLFPMMHILPWQEGASSLPLQQEFELAVIDTTTSSMMILIYHWLSIMAPLILAILIILVMPFLKMHMVNGTVSSSLFFVLVTCINSYLLVHFSSAPISC